MNFSQLFHKSNSSINSLEGNILESSVIQRRGDLVLIDTGLTNSSLCFHNELKLSKMAKSPHITNCIIGIQKVESNNGEPILVLPKFLQKFSRRKFVWTELTKVWHSGKYNRVKGFILNSVKGGYAVAVAGYIAFLPKSLCIDKRVYRGQWKMFSILNMNQQIGNIVVREISGKATRKGVTAKVKNFKAKVRNS